MESHTDDTSNSPSRSLSTDFFCERSAIFRELSDLREKGWENKEAGDQYFLQQRQRADNSNDKGRRILFNLMRQIGKELHDTTHALSLPGPSPQVLDLCMAPGGFTSSVLKLNNHARVSGITLPKTQGGHELLVRSGPQDPRVDCTELDITMLSTEFGIDATDIPDTHPDKANFLPGQRPYLNRTFDLIFCNGQVLRMHTHSSSPERNEARRLTCAQLILALQRIRTGGTMIILLHKVEAGDTMNLLFQFHRFAHIRLFKPQRKQRMRNSFYLVATDVDPTHAVAVAAVQGWKDEWRAVTFRHAPADDGEALDVVKARSSGVDQRVLAEFGERLVELADPIWAILRDALRDAPFTPGGRRCVGNVATR